MKELMFVHVWISRFGYRFSSTRNYPVSTMDKMKYIGHTTDMKWPKKMNTGRVLFEPQSKTLYGKKKKKAILTPKN